MDQTATFNILFLLSAGTSVVITVCATGFLKFIRECVSNDDSDLDCYINFETGYLTEYESLWIASITGMVGIILTTLFSVSKKLPYYELKGLLIIIHNAGLSFMLLVAHAQVEKG